VRTSFRNRIETRLSFTNRSRTLVAIRSCKRQANLNLQPTLGPIGGFHASAVEAHGALRDCQTQASPTSLSATRVVNAIEGPEEVVQRFLEPRGLNR
jgi:hypothetical protein